MRRRCFLPTGTLASTNSTLFGANVLPRAFCSSPPVHPSPLSPALQPSQFFSSSTPLHVGAPQPQVRSVEETFTRILKKGKEGEGRKRGYDGENRASHYSSKYFFSIFLL